MNELYEKLLKELRDKHGEALDLEEHHYFLFYKDGLFQFHLDEDEKSIQVEVTLMGDAARVYHTDKSMVEELGIFEEK